MQSVRMKTRHTANPSVRPVIRMPTRYTSSADTHAMVARITPSILGLLGDGIPRNRRAFVATSPGLRFFETPLCR